MRRNRPEARVSPALSAFVRDAPHERPAILRFVKEAATSTPPGARVLDAGAGQAPYRELFGHCQYVTSDWSRSAHPIARSSDIVAPLDSLPIADDSFDAVVSTQVLEHVRSPGAVLRELHRVLVPGGRLWLTAPFVGELHEEPYDFYRYTEHGLRQLVETASFAEVRVQPLSGYFTALAQMLHNCGVATGVRAERSDIGRRLIAAAGRALARPLPALDRFDRRRALPLTYSCRAVKVEDVSRR
jgi:SAM-dependent methyltransferase